MAGINSVVLTILAFICLTVTFVGVFAGLVGVFRQPHSRRWGGFMLALGAVGLLLFVWLVLFQ